MITFSEKEILIDQVDAKALIGQTLTFAFWEVTEKEKYISSRNIDFFKNDIFWRFAFGKGLTSAEHSSIKSTSLDYLLKLYVCMDSKLK